jgi:hypothetical protein
VRHSFEQAVALDPFNAPWYTAETWALICVGDLDGALASSEKGIAVNPGDPAMQVNRALALARDGKCGEARDLMAQAFRPEPLPPPWFGEFNGVIAFAEGRHEETLARVEPIGDFAWDNMYALACCANFGRAAKARAMLARLNEQGRQPDWHLGLSREPFRDRSVWNRLQDGLNAAHSF